MAGYIDIGRNDPCPCYSGKKFKKCCRETVEKMMLHWNNIGRWPWISPQLQKALSLVCGLPPGEGEAPTPAARIERALDHLTKTVFDSEKLKRICRRRVIAVGNFCRHAGGGRVLPGTAFF